MSIKCDVNFDFKEGSIDLPSLDNALKNSKILNSLKSVTVQLVDVENSFINPFTDENFCLEEQDEFFKLIKSCIFGDNDEVVVFVNCLEADSREKYTITKNNIREETN